MDKFTMAEFENSLDMYKDRLVEFKCIINKSFCDIFEDSPERIVRIQIDVEIRTMTIHIRNDVGSIDFLPLCKFIESLNIPLERIDLDPIDENTLEIGCIL